MGLWNWLVHPFNHSRIEKILNVDLDKAIAGKKKAKEESLRSEFRELLAHDSISKRLHPDEVKAYRDRFKAIKEKQKKYWKKVEKQAESLPPGFMSGGDFMAKAKAEAAYTRKMNKHKEAYARSQRGTGFRGWWGRHITGARIQMQAGYQEKIRHPMRRKIGWRRIIIFIIIAILILYVANTYLTGTVLGSQLGAGSTLLAGGVREQSRVFVGPLNVLGQILSGQYDVNTLWTSEVVEEEYDRIAKDVGVKAVALRSQRPVYFPVLNPNSTKIRIDGRLEVKNPPGEETTVTVNAIGALEGCETAAPDESWCLLTRADWKCTILGSEDEDNLHKVTVGDVRRDMRFYCERNGIGYSAELERGFAKTLLVNIIVEYDSVAYTGRQMFVVDSLEAEKVFAETGSVDGGVLALPILGIPSGDTVIQKSWQKGDESISFSLGVYGQDEGILLASSKEFTRSLGIKLLNPVFAGSNVITKVYDVSVYVPDGIEGLSFLKEDFDDEVEVEGENVKILVKEDIEKDLAAGESHVLIWYVDARDDFLAGAPFSSFFIFAEVNFKMKTKQLVSIQVLGMDPIADEYPTTTDPSPEAVCGNSELEEGEECDPPSTWCDEDCNIIPGCGNGVVEEDEECDDGNNNDGDGCSSTCEIVYSNCNNFCAEQGFGVASGYCIETTCDEEGGNEVSITDPYEVSECTGACCCYS